MPSCPQQKYLAPGGICRECSDQCRGGCTGPGTSLHCLNKALTDCSKTQLLVTALLVKVLLVMGFALTDVGSMSTLTRAISVLPATLGAAVKGALDLDLQLASAVPTYSSLVQAAWQVVRMGPTQTNLIPVVPAIRIVLCALVQQPLTARSATNSPVRPLESVLRSVLPLKLSWRVNVNLVTRSVPKDVRWDHVVFSRSNCAYRALHHSTAQACARMCFILARVSNHALPPPTRARTTSVSRVPRPAATRDALVPRQINV